MSQDGKDGFDWVSITANTHGPQRKGGGVIGDRQ